MIAFFQTSNDLERFHLLVIELKHPIFGFERSNIELRTQFNPSLLTSYPKRIFVYYLPCMPPSYVNVVLCCVLNSISKEVMSKLFFPSGLVERKIVYKKSAFLQMNEHFLATERIFNKLISCFLRPLLYSYAHPLGKMHTASQS